ncbi:single-stranded DNA-binding protein [Vreelandella andesensis]|uniref:Single-stranded DNA-binding protein n=1 Tax=Vreelandella andesensis TaxID=447567 RepID=A0A3S0W360_9GAMM|nr:single-stranded DNA-binding protein [Halomonas andesensis]RUR26804.1 single-stranded DNA-binding protein [Halomonas andesensis]
MNVFTGIGRIGRDVEVRSTQNGTAVAGFPVAVDVGYGDNKSTLWLDCALFGKRAEGGVVQYLTKGQQVGVTGELGTRQFQKNDGSQGFAVTLRLNDLTLAGSQQSGQQQQPRQQPQQQPQQNYQQAQQQRPPQNQPPQGQQHQAYGATDPGQHDDFDSEIPF